jgi:large subunit ribosomal protein L24
MPRHIRKGDTVMITSGDFKGQTGEIASVDTKKETVLIKGVNLVTKHVKPTQAAPQGSVITKEAPIHWSKVSPVVDGKAVRVGFQVKPDGSKVRVARHGGKVLKELGTLRSTKSGSAKPAKKSAKK